jgi:hypothetical protein
MQDEIRHLLAEGFCAARIDLIQGLRQIKVVFFENVVSLIRKARSQRVHNPNGARPRPQHPHTAGHHCVCLSGDSDQSHASPGRAELLRRDLGSMLDDELGEVGRCVVNTTAFPLGGLPSWQKPLRHPATQNPQQYGCVMSLMDFSKRWPRTSTLTSDPKS